MPIKNFIWPIQRSEFDGYFEMTNTTLRSVKENLKLFLVTDESERVVRNNLGSRIRRLLFSNITKSTEKNIEDEVHRIFSTFFSFLVLNKAEVKLLNNDDDMSRYTVSINIDYSFKDIDSSNDNLNVIVG